VVKSEEKPKHSYMQYKWINKILLPVLAQTFLAFALVTSFFFSLINFIFLGGYTLILALWIFRTIKASKELREIEEEVTRLTLYYHLAKAEMFRFQIVHNVLTEFIAHDISKISKTGSSVESLLLLGRQTRIRKIIEEMADTLRTVHNHKIEAISTELGNKLAEDLVQLTSQVDYRITLMVVEKQGPEEVLITKYWSRFSGRVPRIVQKNIKLKKGEGVAGTSWSQGRAKYIESISKDREGAGEFKDLGYGRPMQTKSMMSYPLVNEWGSKRDFFGIINIDSTKDEHFVPPPDQVNHEDIEIITPLIRQLIFYLKINEFGEH